MKTPGIKKTIYAFTIVVGLLFIAACHKSDNGIKPNQNMTQADSLKEKFAEVQKIMEIKSNLVNIDSADFLSYPLKEWIESQGTHAQELRVFWPEGSQTIGREKFFNEFLALFAHAPDTRIVKHPIQIGSDNRTAITGTIQGTFTKPMQIGNGKAVYPTGKAFATPVTVIGIWDKGQMIEIHLHWSNELMMEQLGFFRRR